MTTIHLHSNEKTALDASGGFEHHPILDGTLSNTGEDGPPPPHRQLLSDEPAYYEELKGYKHTQEEISYEDCYDTHDGYGVTNEDSYFCCRKKEGGGSWLLGIARLRERAALPLVEGENEGVGPPGLVRDESDEDSSSDSEDDASASSEEESLISKQPPKRRGVSFDAAVTVQPIPHSSTLSPIQRRSMYCSSLEIYKNKTRNKKEYRYDGYDWRNATEEWEMGVDMVTGELVHPAHEEAW